MSSEKRIDGEINGESYSIPAGCVVRPRELVERGAEALNLLGELDRSPSGRHEGDAESQDPTGVSQGNPLLPAGTHIGHHISGRPIVVPPWRSLQDPAAWLSTQPTPKGKD